MKKALIYTCSFLLLFTSLLAIDLSPAHNTIYANPPNVISSEEGSKNQEDLPAVSTSADEPRGIGDQPEDYVYSILLFIQELFK